MDLKKAVGILLILIAIYYVMGFMGDPFLLIIFLPIALLCVSMTAFLLMTDLIWKLFPPHVKGNNDKGKFLYGAPFVLLISLLAMVSPNTTKIDGYKAPYSSEALKSLPYLTWLPMEEKDAQKSGVTKHDTSRAFKGLNIYTPQNLSTAYLIDMSGKVLHTWSAKINESGAWQHIEMYDNGDLLSIASDTSLVKLDWDSNIKWIKKMRFHHDIAIAGNQDIYVLGRRDDVVFIAGLPVPILDDYIVVLSPDGEIKKELSLFKVLKKEIPFRSVIDIYAWMIRPRNLWELVGRKTVYDYLLDHETSFDVFHTNTIQLIDRNISGLCNRGDILISVRQLDLVGIVDARTEKLIWKWGPGNLNRQHHPTLLENGHILIFDNGTQRKYSRVVELDPVMKEITWEYATDPPHEFYSATRGANQRLPNGNTLVTDSNMGRAFEVTKDGDIVWEFYNPEIKRNHGERAAIYRMMRIINPEYLSFYRSLR